MSSQTLYREMGLNDAEYQKICDTLSREPTYTELGMYAVMWSEHCGYKYSRPVLALFKSYKEAQESGSLEPEKLEIAKRYRLPRQLRGHRDHEDVVISHSVTFLRWARTSVCATAA